jgi:hypothetical protein
MTFENSTPCRGFGIVESRKEGINPCRGLGNATGKVLLPN